MRVVGEFVHALFSFLCDFHDQERDHDMWFSRGLLIEALDCFVVISFFLPYFPVRASFINPKVYAVLQIKTNPQSNKKRKLNTGASADRDTDTAWLERIGWREYARIARDFKRGSRRTAKWQQKLILLTTAEKKTKISNKSNNTGNKKSNCHYNCEVALAVTSHFAVQQKSCFLCFTVNMHTYVQKCKYIYIKNSYINVSIYS